MLTPAALGLAVVEEPNIAPAGPPTNASWYFYSGDKVGLQWTAGDPLASTEVEKTTSPATCDFGDFRTVSPGVEFLQTGQTQQCLFRIRHVRSGIPTAWVQVTSGPIPCVACA